MKKINYIRVLFFLMLFALLPISMQLTWQHSHEMLSVKANMAHANDGWLGIPSWNDLVSTVKNYSTRIISFLFIGLPIILVNLFDITFGGAIQEALVNFASTYNAFFSDAVNNAWVLSRDFANLIIISLFVYAAVGTILRLKDYNLEKFIVKIIIVALLVNFSMFFAKLAIDVSNAIALQFLKQVEKIEIVHKTPDQNSKDGENWVAPENWIYVGSAMRSKLGIASIYDNSELAKQSEKHWFYVNFVILPIYAFILSFIAGVLAYGTIVILARFLGLILIIALSAVGFIMMIVPNIGEKFWNQWWGNLLRYVIFAPLFSFMLLISLIIISKMDNNTSLVKALVEGNISDIILKPFIIIGVLLASIKISNSLSIMGSNFASTAAMHTISMGTGVGRALLEPVARRAAAISNKGPLKNTTFAWAMARGYQNIATPAKKDSSLYKQFGIKDLGYDKQKQLDAGVKAAFDAQKNPKKRGDYATRFMNNTAKSLISKLRGNAAQNKTNTDESTTTNKKTTEIQRADTSNYQSVVEGGPSAEAQDKEQIRAAERKTEEVAGNINKDLSSEITQFNDLNEAREYAEKILNEPQPKNTDAESMERWRQRQFRARRMLEMIDEAGKYPAMKDGVLSSVNDIAKKIDNESKVVAKRFREKDFGGSKDAKTAKFMDKLSKEADQMAEEALHDLDKIERGTISRVLGGTNSNLYKTFVSTMEDTSLTPAQKLKLLKDNGMIDTISNAVQSGRLVSADEQSARRMLDKISAAQNILAAKQDPRKIINTKLKRAIDSSSLAAKTKNKLGSIMDDDKKSITEKMRMINTYAKMTGDNALENTVNELSEYENELRQAAKAEKGGKILKQKGIKGAFNPSSKKTVDKVKVQALRRDRLKKTTVGTAKNMLENLDNWIFSASDEPESPEQAALKHTVEELEKFKKENKSKLSGELESKLDNIIDQTKNDLS